MVAMRERYIYRCTQEENAQCFVFSAKKEAAQKSGLREWRRKGREFHAKRGEVTAGHFLGKEPDFGVYRGGDKYDFLWFGLRIGVRYGGGKHYRLSLSVFTGDVEADWVADKDVDLMILVVPEDEESDDCQLEIKGWASKADFIRLAKVRDLKHGDRWVLDNHHLRPFSDFLGREAESVVKGILKGVLA
jgi:hypothetical protein